MSAPGGPVIHLLWGLTIGGLERSALRLARAGTADGEDHALWLYDTPFRNATLDLDPGSLPTRFLYRRPGFDSALILRLARAFAAERPSVVHAYNETAFCYAALARLCLPARRPALIGTIHTWPSHPTKRARRLTRLLASTASAIAVVSHDLGRRLSQAGWIGDHIVIPNGIDLQHFAPGPDDGGWHRRLGVAETAPLLVHVARFDPVKRHEDVIDAAHRVHAERPDAVFVFAGDGPRLGPLRQLFGHRPYLRFVGNVADPAPLLRAASACLLASADEAAPQALLEALACACPCIATPVGDIPHLLGTDTATASGLAVPVGDSAALAAAILAVLGTPALRAQLSDNGPPRAQLYSAQQERDAYRALYAAPASSARAGRAPICEIATAAALLPSAPHAASPSPRAQAVRNPAA